MPHAWVRHLMPGAERPLAPPPCYATGSHLHQLLYSPQYSQSPSSGVLSTVMPEVMAKDADVVPHHEVGPIPEEKEILYEASPASEKLK